MLSRRVIGCGPRIGIRMGNALILETKSVQSPLPVHEAQLLTYISRKISGVPLGLLPNFSEGTLRQDIRRRALQAPLPARRCPRYTPGEPHQEAPMRAIFVQIKCEMGQAYKVAREAADTIDELSELFSTSGQYDLLGKFYLDYGQDVGLFVTERIQTLPGVKDTYTMITFNAFGGA